VTAGPGALIGLLGAALVVFSAWLAWLSRPQTSRQSAYDVPARFLLDRHASAGGVSLGVVILATGVLAVIGAFLAAGRFPALALGVVAIVVAGLFAYQLRLSVNDLNRASHFRTRSIAPCSPCLQRRCARSAGTSRTEALSLAGETRSLAHRLCRYDQRCS
jgi:hypothetical protein